MQETDEMALMITELWQVPSGHRSSSVHEKPKTHRRLDLADLLGAGLLTPGMTLYPGSRKYQGRVATLLPDGHIDVDGMTYPRPSPGGVLHHRTSHERLVVLPRRQDGRSPSSGGTDRVCGYIVGGCPRR